MDLQLVPTGIFYDHYWKFNRTLLVQYGKPIEIDSYKTAYKENALSAMLALREDIRASLEPLTMQINSEKHYIDYENFRAICGEEYAKKGQFGEDKTLHRFKAEQDMIRKIEHLEFSNPILFKELTDRTQTYMVLISRAGYSNQHLVKAQNTNIIKLLAGITGALLSLPVLLFGALFSIIPFLIPREFLTRKIKDTAFRSSINFAVGLLIFPLFYLIESSIIGIVSGSLLAALVTLVVIPFAGKYAYQLLMFDIDLFKVVKLRSINRQLYKKVSAMREGILAIIRTIKS
jgi:hypothetical protein